MSARQGHKQARSKGHLECPAWPVCRTDREKGRNAIKNVHLDPRDDTVFRLSQGFTFRLSQPPLPDRAASEAAASVRLRRSNKGPNPGLHDVLHPKVASAYIQNSEGVVSGQDRAVFPIKIDHRYTDQMAARKPSIHAFDRPVRSLGHQKHSPVPACERNKGTASSTPSRRSFSGGQAKGPAYQKPSPQRSRASVWPLCLERGARCRDTMLSKTVAYQVSPPVEVPRNLSKRFTNQAVS